jgi:hypothetical protein
MLATITAITIKPASKKSCGQVIKLLGGYTENVLPAGQDGASDPTKTGNLTLQIEGGRSWGFACKMKARYKLADGGGTEVSWTLRPDEPLDDDRVRLIAGDIRGEQNYIVAFKEQGA